MGFKHAIYAPVYAFSNFISDLALNPTTKPEMLLALTKNFPMSPLLKFPYDSPIKISSFFDEEQSEVKITLMFAAFHSSSFSR